MNTSPIIAEIVGPSGAGKSTLSSALNSSNSNVLAGLTVWRLPRLKLALSALASAPDLSLLAFDRRRIRKDELKQVVRLDAFYRMLRRYEREANRYSALLLDEGVVFALAKLLADVNVEPFGKRMRRWEESVLNRWSSMLDAIVWLDASDAVLIHRIRTRAKHHRMKGMPDAVIKEFLKNYRSAYDAVVGDLASRAHIKVLKFQTDDLHPDEMVDAVMEMCGQIAKARGGRTTEYSGVQNAEPIRSTTPIF